MESLSGNKELGGWMILKFFKWYVNVYIRLVKLIIAWPLSKIFSQQLTRESVSMDDIAKQDLIDSLDVQISSLENEKQYYIRVSQMSKIGEDQRVKLQSKIAQIDVKIRKLTRQVLKLREEIEK